ncbi:MAG: trehalase family glycosidase [Mangrovibacterium sp.]
MKKYNNIVKVTIYLLLVFIFHILPGTNSHAQKKLNINILNDSENHDIQLSPWGPYSKRYAGISHISDIKKGLRLDFTLCPGYYRNNIMVPNVLFDSSYSPWEISPEMDKITYRYQMEWKDKVYIDATYFVLDSSEVLIEMNCVNNTDYSQNLTLNSLLFINYPDAYPKVKASGHESMKWISAVDYTKIDMAVKPPQFRLVRDGLKLCEVRSNESIDGSLLANRFGKEVNDEVVYSVNVDKKKGEGKLYFRYRVDKGDTARFKLSGICDDYINFVGTGNFEIQQQSCRFDSENVLKMSSSGKSEIEFDGFFISQDATSSVPQIVPQNKYLKPDILFEEGTSKLILKYKDIDKYYGLKWDYPYSEVREVLNNELDIFFKITANNNGPKSFPGNGEGHFTNLYLRPIEVEPKVERKLYLLLSAGTETEVNEKLDRFNLEETLGKISVNPPVTPVLPAGKKFEFGNKMLQAALLSNVVYPIYTQRQYIRHFTPGKWWNSLYTWDVGFVALGMKEVDIQKSYEIINAYTTPVGSQSAFIHHGSPVPVQFFAFFDLWNKTQSKKLLTYLYPRLKQYFQFMTGEIPTSTTRMPSNLLRTWDYFYNSGGWDDYPPQRYLRNNPAEYKNITSVVTTAYCIRVAKIMRLCALSLGMKNDVTYYDRQIEQFAHALNKFSWDEESGYFSYVIHDANGLPLESMRYGPDKSNFNMGLDGVSPIVSGICNQSQQEKLIKKIFSGEHLWTPYGITAVDQSASYYEKDGYWNGTVWMPHQWFIWKSMLDIGEGEKAYLIAKTALDLWERETELTYKTFEHFINSSGRGAGWSQFSGLSAPVLNWFASYYKTGTVTTGFEIWIEEQQFNSKFSSYNAKLKFDDTSQNEKCILVCMNPDYNYKAFFNDLRIKTISYHPGFLQIYLPATGKQGQLKVLVED